MRTTLTEAEDWVVLHQRPGAVVHTVALVDQELADVPRRHVGGDLHHFPGPILAPHLHDLENTEGDNDEVQEEQAGCFKSTEEV